MYLVVAATDLEMRPFLASSQASANHETLVTGVGILETSVRLTSFLASRTGKLRGVINFGIGGAYIQNSFSGKTPELLDICLAEQEILGDFGVCLHQSIEYFKSGELQVENTFSLKNVLLEKTRQILDKKHQNWHSGSFITVNCATGTDDRGHYLQRTHNALCENMEGAAVARVCEEFQLPCLEIRCISNFVETRDVQKWRLRDACQKSGMVAASVVRELCR